MKPQFSAIERESTENIFKDLTTPLFDIINLRLHAFSGIPTCFVALRALIWKIVIGYFPSNKADWDEKIPKMRREYFQHMESKISPELVKTILNGKGLPPGSSMQELETLCALKREDSGPPADSPSKPSLKDNCKIIAATPCEDDHPLSTNKNSNWHQYFADQQLWEEIVKDVRRTRGELLDGANFTLTKILFLFIKTNPGMRYLQGMNEIVAVIYYVFSKDPIAVEHAEADAFHVFSRLILEMKEHFTFEPAQTGQSDGQLKEDSMLVTQLKETWALLKKVDNKLYNHFTQKGIEYHFVILKWYTSLFTQEFNPDATFKIFDGIMTHKRKSTLIKCLCVSVLICLHTELLKATDFATIMITIQNIRTVDTSSALNLGNNMVSEYCP